MIKISVIAVGKLKEKFWKDACAEYLKRLEGYANVSVKEVPDSSKEKEAQALITALPEKAPLLLLDIKGKATSSEALSQKLTPTLFQGTAILFVIGEVTE